MLPSFSKSALALVNRALRLSAVAAAADRFLLLLPPLPFSLSSEDEEDPLPSSEILLTEDEEEAEAEEAALAAEAVGALALSTSMEILFGLVMSERGSVFLLKRTSLSLLVVSNCWFMKRLAILETCPSFTAATTVVFAAAAAGPLPPRRGNAYVTSRPKEKVTNTCVPACSLAGYSDTFA